MNGPIPARWAPELQSVLRIVVAHKAFGFPSGEPTPGVPLFSLLGLASGLGPWSLDAAWGRSRSG